MNNTIFDRINGVSPVPQDFVWLSDHIDGTYLCEFDFNTKEKNDFYKINRDTLSNFGLIGQGMKLFFDAKTGIFNLNGTQIYFSYKTKDKEYNLTSANCLYNDIITYKDAYTDANIRNPQDRFTSHIHQYNFGYKTKISFGDETEFAFQVICSIPYNSPAYFEIKLVANRDLDGELYIKRVGRITESIKAPLQEGYAGMTEWVIK